MDYSLGYLLLAISLILLVIIDYTWRETRIISRCSYLQKNYFIGGGH